MGPVSVRREVVNPVSAEVQVIRGHRVNRLRGAVRRGPRRQQMVGPDARGAAAVVVVVVVARREAVRQAARTESSPRVVDKRRSDYGISPDSRYTKRLSVGRAFALLVNAHLADVPTRQIVAESHEGLGRISRSGRKWACEPIFF